MKRSFKEGFLAGVLGDNYQPYKTRQAINEQTAYLQRRDAESASTDIARQRFNSEIAPALLLMDEGVAKVVGCYNAEDADGAKSALDELEPVASALESAIFDCKLDAWTQGWSQSSWWTQLEPLFDRIREVTKGWSRLPIEMLMARTKPGPSSEDVMWSGIEAANRDWVRLANEMDALAGTTVRTRPAARRVASALPDHAGSALPPSPSTPRSPPAGADAADGSERPTKTCPDCAETILEAARICRFCRYEFWPADSLPPASTETDGPEAAATGQADPSYGTETRSGHDGESFASEPPPVLEPTGQGPNASDVSLSSEDEEVPVAMAEDDDAERSMDPGLIDTDAPTREAESPSSDAGQPGPERQPEGSGPPPESAESQPLPPIPPLADTSPPPQPRYVPPPTAPPPSVPPLPMAPGPPQHPYGAPPASAPPPRSAPQHPPYPPQQPATPPQLPPNWRPPPQGQPPRQGPGPLGPPPPRPPDRPR